MPLSDGISWPGWGTMCIILLMTTSAFAQDLHYQEDLLKDYVRLGQQLRAEMTKILNQMLSRLNTLNQAVTDVRVDIYNRMVDGINLAAEQSHDLINITTYMKLNYAPVTVVYGPSSYTFTGEPYFTSLVYDHGIGYNTRTASARTPFAGLYEVQYRLQTYDYNSVSLDLYVYSPNGELLHNVKHKWLAACNPMIETFELDVGSRIVLSEVKAYSPDFMLVPNSVTTGFTSQLSVRYFGPV